MVAADQLPRPKMSAAASFHGDDRPRIRSQKTQKLLAGHFLAESWPSIGCGPVKLEHTLARSTPTIISFILPSFPFRGGLCFYRSHIAMPVGEGGNHPICISHAVAAVHFCRHLHRVFSGVS